MRITDANLFVGLALLELFNQVFEPICPLILTVSHQLLLELLKLAFYQVLIGVTKAIVFKFVPNKSLGYCKVLILLG